MNFALGYVIQRFFFRLGDFFHHWYVDGSRWILYRFMQTVSRLDRTFAVRITLAHFFEPLYKDFTVIGRILGVIFRSVRVVIGGFVYLLIALLFLAILVAWLAVPPVIVLYAFSKLY